MRNHLQNNKKKSKNKNKKTRRCLFKSSTVFHLFSTSLCCAIKLLYTEQCPFFHLAVIYSVFSVHKSRTAIEDKMKKFQHRNASQRI